VNEEPSVGILTVDDQPLFRQAARDVIEATPGFACVGEAASGQEALEVVARLGPALILVDVRMPGMDGIETARRVLRARPSTVVVLVSVEDPADLPSNALSSGAAALIRKQDFRPTVLRRLWSIHGCGGG
jgi:two-component system invasion response regulator UvrY